MAADGALVGGKCFVSADDATDAYYSAVAPAQTAGAVTYLSEFVKGSGGWVLRRYQVGSDGSIGTLADAQVPAMSFPSCDPRAAFFDGMTMGWGVVAAMAAAWAVVAMRKGL
jgi:hypothetical protein